MRLQRQLRPCQRLHRRSCKLHDLHNKTFQCTDTDNGLRCSRSLEQKTPHASWDTKRTQPDRAFERNEACGLSHHRTRAVKGWPRQVHPVPRPTNSPNRELVTIMSVHTVHRRCLKQIMAQTLLNTLARKGLRTIEQPRDRTRRHRGSKRHTS